MTTGLAIDDRSAFGARLGVRPPVERIELFGRRSVPVRRLALIDPVYAEHLAHLLKAEALAARPDVAARLTRLDARRRARSAPLAETDLAVITSRECGTGGHAIAGELTERCGAAAGWDVGDVAGGLFDYLDSPPVRAAFGRALDATER